MGLLNRKKKQKNSMFLYSEEALNQYEEYIMEQFGEYESVFHELVSLDIHLDILIIPPTEEHNYYQLITMGMGAYSMNTPRELKDQELERAELVLCLPPTWNIQSSKEEDYWPIRQLKSIARLPIYNDTWLGYGHTISSDEDNNPYASDTKFCSMLLVDVNKDRDLRIDGMGKINFYQLFPLYKEELEYKFHHDADSLLQRFDEEALSGVIDNQRKNFGIE